MLKRLHETTAGYPRQFWLLFWGVLINSSGSSLVWPFLTIYLRQRLDVPLTTIALLFTLNALAGLASTSLTGPAVDRFGRKGAMALSLGAGCVFMLALTRVDTLGSAAVLMVFKGFTDPLYRVGSDAMVADLIPPARRAGAYSLLRMICQPGRGHRPVDRGLRHLGLLLAGLLDRRGHDAVLRAAGGGLHARDHPAVAGRGAGEAGEGLRSGAARPAFHGLLRHLHLRRHGLLADDGAVARCT